MGVSRPWRNCTSCFYLLSNPFAKIKNQTGLLELNLLKRVHFPGKRKHQNLKIFWFLCGNPGFASGSNYS